MLGFKKKLGVFADTYPHAKLVQWVPSMSTLFYQTVTLPLIDAAFNSNTILGPRFYHIKPHVICVLA